MSYKERAAAFLKVESIVPDNTQTEPGKEVVPYEGGSSDMSLLTVGTP